MFRPMKVHHQEVSCRIQTLWYSAASKYARYYGVCHVEDGAAAQLWKYARYYGVCHVEDGAAAQLWKQFCG
jgi:hypothetical protein